MRIAVRAAALVLGGGLALLTASPSGAQYEQPKKLIVSPTGVNIPDGKFTTSAVDLSIGPFKLERSYVGGGKVDGTGLFGLNWTHNYVTFVSEGLHSEYGKTKVTIGRQVISFSKWGTAYQNTSEESYGTSLVDQGGTFVYTDRQGNVYTFNPSVNAFPPYPNRRNQSLARVDYSDGHRLTYTYNSAGKLIQIASNYGYALVFEYAANGYVSKACGYNAAVTYVTAAMTCAGAPLSVSYGYDAGVQADRINLNSVTDAMNNVWGYTYLGTSNVSQMTCVKQVNSSSCRVANSFDGPGRTREVKSQTLADGSAWTYVFIGEDPDDPRQPGEPPAHSEAHFYGPEGTEVHAEFGGGLMNWYNQNGRMTYLSWNGLELSGIQHHELNGFSDTTDMRGNHISNVWTPKPNSGLQTIDDRIFYPEDGGIGDCTTVVRKICNKPVYRLDYNDNRTDFTWDPTHGGVLTETGPAGLDGIRPVKRIGYTQRFAWVAVPGGYWQVPVGIWLPVIERTCRTSATVGSACQAGAADEVVTHYDYGPDSGPNNLALRSKAVVADGITMRECFGYDSMGNRIWQTGPREGLTCPAS